MTFFGHGHHHGAGDAIEHQAGTSYSYVITSLVQEQRSSGSRLLPPPRPAGTRRTPPGGPRELAQSPFDARLQQVFRVAG
jgi:hypothetical protein